MTLLDRHLDFVEALRTAGLPVSLAEGLDAVAAIEKLGIGDREIVRAGYAATMIKRHAHRATFDQVFELYFPERIGQGSRDARTPVPAVGEEPGEPAFADALAAMETPAALADFREALATALAMGDPDALTLLAREAVQRFGLIQGREPGEQRWSAYNVTNRVQPEELVARALRGLGLDVDDDPATTRLVQAQTRVFGDAVDAEVRRRAAEVRGPAHLARHTVRPTIEQLDFTRARREDLDQLRREIQPLARRLATRLSKEHHARRARGPLDFRATIRASMSAGGVPVDPRQRPKRPGRSDLVVLCDVSGSVANFASFTLLLVFALREQFGRVRAFTFVDEVHEVTDRFDIAADPGQVMADLAASARHASLWGRTNYGRAFTRFAEQHADALTPRTNLLVLGDARSNHSDLALPAVAALVHAARHAWWLNPEHPRSWDTGDSAASDYGALIPMVECRNLTQLGEFVHDLT